VGLAGVSTDTIESHRSWTARMKLPYPLLSDADRRVCHALGLVRRIGGGPWTIELYRRSTLLVDVDGVVAAIWGHVKVRGHASEVLRAARVLVASPTSTPPEAP